MLGVARAGVLLITAFLAVAPSGSRLFAGDAPAADAQAQAKQTIMVPMTDKTRLATDVFLPSGPGTFPCILIRTPYGREAIGGMGKDGANRGYVIVAQDTRGRFGSEGVNLPFASDGWDGAQDGVDTVAWILSQPWSNGKIGTFGGSALGITQLHLAGAGKGGVAAQHITVGAPNLYADTVYPGGVFKKAMVEDWLRVSKFATNALTIWTSHPVHDAYWEKRELDKRYNLVQSPAVHIGGWYDIFCQGTIDAFRGYQYEGGKGARGKQRLIIGPWTHGVFQDKAGDLKFPDGKKPPFGTHDAWRWFDFALRGATNGYANDPVVQYYTMGDVTDAKAPGNCWRSASAWPPFETKPVRFYPHADGGLKVEKPSGSGQLEYSYDPAKPAPTIGGPQLTLPAGAMDQRSLEARSDVLTFVSPPLAQPFEITGRVLAKLQASSDGPDTDFFVKLCDTYPDGRTYNICEGQLRARFRGGLTKEVLLKPGKAASFTVDLGSTSIILNKGHRLKLLVTSSSAPGFDPNPNTGEAFRSSSRQRIARNTLFFGGKATCSIELPCPMDGPTAPFAKP